MENKIQALTSWFKSQPRSRQILIIIIAGAVLGAIFGDKKSSSSNYSSPTSTYESTTPSFTCKNCGGHSFRYHETVTNMQICTTCGVGQ